MTQKNKNKPLKVVAVCGLGMGSSLILRMTLESILKELEVEANVEHSEFSAARGMGADVIVGQEIHTEIFKELDPVVVTVKTFTDREVIKSQIEETFKKNGWL